MLARHLNRAAAIVVVSLVSLALSQIASAAVVTGLEAHWSYDDGTGSVITSSVTPATHNATISASPDWVTGVIGGAHRFNGANAATTSSVDLAPNINLPLTLATWVRPENYSTYQVANGNRYGGLINKYISNNGNFAWALENMQNAYFDGGWKASASTVAENEWSHVAVTVADGTARYYHNGILTGTASASILGVTASPVYTLGAITSTTYRLQGALDDSGVWKSAKSDAEIAAIHGLGLFSQVALNDPVLDQLLALNALNDSVSNVGPGADTWYYTNLFDSGNPLPLQVGLAYTGDSGHDYIVLHNLGGEWYGLTTMAPPPAPEPSTALLLCAGLVGMRSARRRQRMSAARNSSCSFEGTHG